MLKAVSKKATLMLVVKKATMKVVSILKPSSMESLVNISKAPLDDVETLNESHEMVTVTSLTMVEESIQESHGDVVTAAAMFPHDDVEEDLEEEPRVPEAKLLSMKRLSYDLLTFCVLGKLF